MCSVVTAVSKEVLSGTDGVVISCKVTGITKTARVKWVNSDNIDVKSTTGHTVDEGTENGGTQRTNLTVASGQTTADADYTCQITPASPDDTTLISKTVSLNIFSKFNIFRDVCYPKSQ